MGIATDCPGGGGVMKGVGEGSGIGVKDGDTTDVGDGIVVVGVDEMMAAAVGCGAAVAGSLTVFVGLASELLAFPDREEHATNTQKDRARSKERVLFDVTAKSCENRAL
jgi:hypothetical protein